MLAFKDEIDNYKTIISKQFNKIMELEKSINHLKNINAVKFESFRQQARKEIDELIKQNQLIEENIIKEKCDIEDQCELLNYKINLISLKEIHSKEMINITNELKDRFFRKYNFINNILKEHNYNCCVCYEYMTVENIIVPKCHEKHYICSSCFLKIDKCPICKNSETFIIK